MVLLSSGQSLTRSVRLLRLLTVQIADSSAQMHAGMAAVRLTCAKCSREFHPRQHTIKLTSIQVKTLKLYKPSISDFSFPARQVARGTHLCIFIFVPFFAARPATYFARRVGGGGAGKKTETEFAKKRNRGRRLVYGLSLSLPVSVYLSLALQLLTHLTLFLSINASAFSAAGED